MISTINGLELVSVKNGIATVRVHPYLVKDSATVLYQKLADILCEHPNLKSIHMILRPEMKKQKGMAGIPTEKYRLAIRSISESKKRY